MAEHRSDYTEDYLRLQRQLRDAQELLAEMEAMFLPESTEPYDGWREVLKGKVDAFLR